MTDPIRILLVDDHAVVREGYRRLLESEPSLRLVGEASDGPQACQRARALRPDVVVMDIGLPGISGIEATRRLIDELPQLRVLVLSMYDDAIYASRALEAGARGYISKVSAPEVLVRAIYIVARGESYLSSDVAANIGRSAAQFARSKIDALTARQLEILHLLVQGETIKGISEKLGLSEKTIANQQWTIRAKLGAKNGAQLALRAAKIGLAPR
ncbi:MAG TPA: response regulator transcription factor [Steroidobacteraceae bacterium]|jgi:DNA-binding NarL/FixJ family response regulator|nr:response regulator transcription factor [Steroidobacteraceae bacterium]